MSVAPQDRGDFQVALFCALPLEAENVQSVFDVCWDDHGKHYGKAAGDQNTYTTGTIGKHNVVLVHMPSMGSNSAALAAAGLRSSFLGIKLALVVGICGVAPVHPTTKRTIILGDVIISTAVIQYDFGRQFPGGFQRKKGVEDSLGQANPEIRSFVNMLATRHNRQRFSRKLEHLVKSKEYRNEIPTATYPGVVNDRLHESSYIHRHRSGVTCDKCLIDAGTCSRSCDELECEVDGLIARDGHARDEEQFEQDAIHTPYVHLGRFGSANTVMKSGLDRDRISAADEVTAFEMEGAGVWEQYPTIVIKAACDYADSHKNKRWQDYAAAMAAACMKVFLEEWVIPDQSSDKNKFSEPVWHVPFDLVSGFVSRENELRELEQKLFDSDNHQIVSLLGLGGVGKSRLAMKFAYQIKSKYPRRSILWIQASDQLTFENDMLEIGRKLGISTIDDEKADAKVLVKQHLSLPSTNKWLLILDNADDEVLWGRRSNSKQQEFSLADHLPKTSNGSILITTRTRLVASFLAEKEVINLSTMTQDEAADLFISRLEDPNFAADRDALFVLVNKLANLPLAVVQAASYVNMTRIPIRTYLELLNQPEAEVVRLLSSDFGDASRYPDAINPVAATWLISFEQIQERHALAADFLSTMACLHEKGIPSSLLPEVDSKIDSIEALAVLTGYSFVSKQSRMISMANGDELYEIHRLVQLAARSWLKKRETISQWTKACVVRLARLFPDVCHEHRSIYTMYLPHAQRLWEEDEQEDCRERYDLLEKMGLCFSADGKYGTAVRAHLAVVSWRSDALGKLDGDTVTAFYYLGNALHHLGEYSEAESMTRLAVDGGITVLGVDHPTTLASMINLGSALSAQNKYAEAEAYYYPALEMEEKMFGKDHPSTLVSKINLTTMLSRQGKYVEAELILREALEINEKRLGKSHPVTLTSMNNLASVLQSQGKYVEAETIHREVLSLSETVLGKSHPNTLKSMDNLAQVLSKQHKYTEVKTLYYEVSQLSRTVLGRNHPDTLMYMVSLANTLREQGDYAGAEKTNRELLQLREAELGKSHLCTLGSMNELAYTLSKQRHKHAEAEMMYREILELFRIVFGERHPNVLICLTNLADVLRKQRKHVEAETFYREALQLRQTELGESHPETLTIMHNLARNLKRQNRTEEAVELMLSCMRHSVDVLGPAHPDTQVTLEELTKWLGPGFSMDQRGEETEKRMPGSWVD